jgi:MoxR-like ATPase
MVLGSQEAKAARQTLQPVLAALEGIVLGKRPQLELSLACLLAGGHLLLEDLPGVGKTTLAHSLARVLGLAFRRLQFTSDLLPADVTGSRVFDAATGTFVFHAGPLFAEVLLADELNRATPRAQGALLEAMEERQVTVDGEPHPLPVPFFVIATQNPLLQAGTFPLPESQLDRFLMRLSLGYPSAEHERALLLGEDRRELVARLTPCLTREALLALQATVRRVHASPSLLDYVQALVGAVRHHNSLEGGLSPRAVMALLRAAQAQALLNGRHGILPEDLQAVFVAVVAHRVQVRSNSGEPRNPAATLPVLTELLANTPLP